MLQEAELEETVALKDKLWCVIELALARYENKWDYKEVKMVRPAPLPLHGERAVATKMPFCCHRIYF